MAKKKTSPKTKPTSKFIKIIEKATLGIDTAFGIFIALTGIGIFRDFNPVVIGEGLLIIILTLVSVYPTRKIAMRSESLTLLIILTTVIFYLVCFAHFLSDAKLTEPGDLSPFLVFAFVLLPISFLLAARLDEAKSQPNAVY